MLDLIKDVKKPIRKYEAVIIVHSEWTEEDVKEFYGKTLKIINSFGGEVSHVESWGKRSLATPIGKIRTGHYLYFLYTGNVGAAEEWERVMKMNDKVLRFLNTRLEDEASLEKHLEEFRTTLTEAKERQAKQDALRSQKRRSFGN